MSKKVCILTSVHTTFDTRIFHKEAKSLVNVGYDVTLIAQYYKNEIVDGVKIIPLLRPKNRLERMTKTVWHVYRKAISANADIYHFHDPELVLVGIILKLYGKKVIYDVHEDYSEAIFYKNWLPLKTLRLVALLSDWFEKLAAHYFDGIVTVTRRIGQRFDRSIRSHVIVVQNFPIVNKIFDKEFMIPWNKRENIVAFVGTIDLIRGIKEMVEAMALIPRKKNIKLILAGNFESESLKKEIESMAGWNRCEYIGYVGLDDVAKILGRAKIGLVLTHPVINLINGQPVKLFEYMCSGIPVIASDFSSWREIIGKSRCGICVNPLDSEAIANAIVYLIDNPIEAEAMGKRGKSAVQERYNWEMEEKKLLEFYNAL
ncbi:MAG TPA: glycosyltransferase family 4 protein [Syntrophales bacterium]|nr:glycosyltransferase family 4 protein [Syntrophales bacterium]